MHYERMNNIADHTEATVLKFLETAAALERRLDRALSNTRGISFSEYRLLRTLSTAGTGGFPRIDLANSVGLSASAVTRALKPLEKLGYVTSQKSDRDARQSRAVITPGGLELLHDALQVLQDTFRDLPLTRLSSPRIAEFSSRLDDLKR